MLRSALFSLFLLHSTHGLALINGKTIESDFPIVRLYFKNNSHICSGVFIDSFTILTAGHCLSDKKTWKGFSIEVEKITDAYENSIDVKWISSSPHPQFSYKWYGNKNDIGVVKTTKLNQNLQFPKLGSINMENIDEVTLYACGKIEVDSKERKCLSGTNSFNHVFNQIIIWGLSSAEGTPGVNVSIAPNDSGGVLVNSKSKKIIGVLWGTWAPLLYKYRLNAPSFITPLDNDNLEFVKNMLGKH